MPGFLIQQGATAICVHGGQAEPIVPNPNVTIDGMATCLLSDLWAIAGCPGVPPSSIPPCVTAQWITGSTRVTSNGQPLLLETSQAICTPTGTPLLPLVTQTRVTAI